MPIPGSSVSLQSLLSSVISITRMYLAYQMSIVVIPSASKTSKERMLLLVILIATLRFVTNSGKQLLQPNQLNLYSFFG